MYILNLYIKFKAVFSCYSYIKDNKKENINNSLFYFSRILFIMFYIYFYLI